jgi:hypothetical protein
MPDGGYVQLLLLLLLQAACGSVVHTCWHAMYCCVLLC